MERSQKLFQAQQEYRKTPPSPRRNELAHEIIALYDYRPGTSHAVNDSMAGKARRIIQRWPEMTRLVELA